MINPEYTAAERQAYIHGAMEVCARLKTSEDVVIELCQELRIKPEELMELRTMALNEGRRTAPVTREKLDGALREKP